MFQTHYGIDSKKEVGIEERADIALNLNADLLVSLHINASATPGAIGAEVFVTRDTSLPKYNKDCTTIGNKILTNLASLGIKNNGVKTRIGNTTATKKDPPEYYYDKFDVDYYGIIRHPRFRNIPAILVEHCFIDSTDTKFIDTDAEIKKIGEADAKAIADFYGLKLKTLEGDVDNSKYVSKIELEISSVTDLKDSEIVLNYVVLPSTALNKDVIWTSDDEAVVTVDSTGKVKLVSAGVANITVETKDGGYKDKCVVTVTELKEGQSIEFKSPLTEKNATVTGVSPETSAKDFKENIQVSEDLKVIVKNKDVELTDEQPIPTGSHILIMDSEDNILVDYIVLVYGDVNGEMVEEATTGDVVDAVDLLLIKRHLLQLILLQFPYNVTADINNDEVIDAIDLLLLKRHLLKIQLIK